MENLEGKEPAIFITAWIANIINIIDKSTVSFLLATVVSILAIIHYFLQIRKSLKDSEPKK